MKIQKTWLEVKISEGNSLLDLTLNYETKEISISNGSNDQTVDFKGKVKDIQLLKQRAKCVLSALEFASKELTIKL